MNHLKEILRDLTDRDVQFAVCGGVAMVLRGFERMMKRLVKKW